MQIEIETPNSIAAKNFAKWFSEEGFESFTKSRFNKLNPKNTDSYITCLATEETLKLYGNEHAGFYFEIE